MKNKVLYVIVGILIIGIVVIGLLMFRGKNQDTSKDDGTEFFFDEEGGFIDLENLPNGAIVQDLGDDKYHITF